MFAIGLLHLRNLSPVLGKKKRVIYNSKYQA